MSSDSLNSKNSTNHEKTSSQEKSANIVLRKSNSTIDELNNRLAQLGITSADFANLTNIATTNGNNTSGRKPSMSGIPREEDKHEIVVKERAKELADSYLDILFTIGEDPFRQGLKKTPERAAKALLHFTKGYEEKIAGKNRKHIKNI